MRSDRNRRAQSNLTNLMGSLSILMQAAWFRWALVATLVLLYSGWIGYVVSRNKPLDFYVYYLAAGAFLRGESAYGASRADWDSLAIEMGVTNYAYPYRYPPLTAQLALPLTSLPPGTAATIWIALTAVALIMSAWLLGKASPLPYGPTLAYLMLLGFVPPLTTMHAGQVNGFLLLAISLAVYSLAHRDWVGAGVGVAVGTLLKLIPLGLVLYLPWRRLWKATIIAVTVMAVLLLTAPLMLGPRTLQTYTWRFFALGSAGSVVTAPPNQSLNGFWGRLLANSVGDELTYRIYLVSAVLVVLGTVACCWPFGKLNSHWSLEFGLIVCALQLITPYAWYHQLVLLLIPLFVLACQTMSGHAPRWQVLPLVVGYLLTDLHGLLWHITPTLLQSAPFCFMLMLWAMLAWLIVHKKREEPAKRGVE